MALPAIVFEGSMNVVRDRTTGITVSVGSTVEFEDVVVGLRDPRFQDGEEVEFPGRLVFKLADGSTTPDPTVDPNSPPCGYKVFLTEPKLRPYLAMTDEFKAYLDGGLRRIWHNRARGS